ncbi:MAG TPA: class II aldolase/adducin family protein [Armatimonadota bacterium]|nr:class II aldolase/adducin family protein [Armatimonadota bacterium]
MQKLQRLVPPFPELSDILSLIGEAGHRLAEIGAIEGAAGNISVFIGWQADPRRLFPVEETITLPEVVPELAGGLILVTGSGRRLREIGNDPSANIGAVVINTGGTTARLYTSHRRLFARLTSEFNSHLAVHRQQVMAGDLNFHAVIHAQPVHLTYLTHIKDYQNYTYLNQHLLRWQPELIVNLPEGVAVAPFFPPGSPELMAANIKAMEKYSVVVWGKHGVMARSAASVKRAADLIEYVETGARYECLNLSNGERASGLTVDEIRLVCERFNIQQTLF